MSVEVFICLSCKNTVTNFNQFKLRVLEVDRIFNTNFIDVQQKVPLNDALEDIINLNNEDNSINIFGQVLESSNNECNVTENCTLDEDKKTVEDFLKNESTMEETIELKNSEISPTDGKETAINIKEQLKRRRKITQNQNKRVKGRLKSFKKDDNPDIKTKKIVTTNKTGNLSTRTRMKQNGDNTKSKRGDDLIDLFPCTECSENFSTKILLNRHFKVSHPQSKPSVKCNECDSTFYYNTHLKKHVIKMHLGNDDRYRCPKCQKCQKSKYSLINHINLVHIQKDPIKCPKCDKMLKHVYSYKAHLKKHDIDPEEKKKYIVCSICGVTVIDIHCHLRRVHSRGAEAEKKLRCRLCTEPRYFNNVVEVREHRREAHALEVKLAQEKEYNIECTLCGRRFTSQGNLNNHRRIFHNDQRIYPCPVCKKMFKNKAYVRGHLKTHFDDRPYICKHCDKGFRTNFKLIIHIRRHTGEKPFMCNVCGKNFRQKSSMKGHMSVHLKNSDLAGARYVNDKMLSNWVPESTAQTACS